MADVSLVIPARDAERTLHPCLEAATDLLRAAELAEIVVVDDGSTDGTARLAGEFPVRLERGPARGPGAARNAGWRVAASPLVWFLDADCVAGSDALARLRPPLDAPEVAGVGGSYGNAEAGSLLAALIQEEIRQRHLAAAGDVDYLGTFNVLYRRSALEEAGGFDEAELNGPGAPGAEDADLSYRLAARGHRLVLEPRSVVLHFHPTTLRRYLRTQRRHGFWGVRLYARHPRRAAGNSYSGLLDHLQPVLALVAVLAIPAALVLPAARWALATALAGLPLCAAPMTLRVARSGLGLRAAVFPLLASLRAFARGAGMAHGLLDLVARRLGRARRAPRDSAAAPAATPPGAREGRAARGR